MSGYSWRGKKVKHKDGREGSIASDYEGFLHRVLTIEVVGEVRALCNSTPTGLTPGKPAGRGGARNSARGLDG